MSPRLKLLEAFLAVFLICVQLLGSASAAETRNDPGGLALNIEERAWLAAHPLVRLGDDFVWPPFVFLDEKGVYSGISSGYIASASKQLGIEIRPILGLTWDQVLEKVKAGEIDILPAVVRSKEREAFLNFTKPYISFPIVIATHREGPEVGDLADLAGRKVGVVKGYFSNELLAKEYPTINLVTFDSLAAGLEAVEARRVDAFVDNLGAITFEARRLRLANVKIAAATKYKFELAMAVRKDWPEFAVLLDKSLDAMSGREKSAIENTWLAIEVQLGVNLKTVLLWLVPLGGSAVFVIVVIVAWNRRLREAITMRDRVTKELRETGARQRAVLRNTPIGIAILNLDRAIIESNDAFCKIFGVQADVIVGQPVRILYADPAQYDDIGRRAYAQILKGDTFSDDVPMRRIDGSTIWVRLVAHLVDEDNRDLGVVWAAEDITERKALELDLKRSNAELERFAYVASHDLRQPLRMISSYLTLLERGLGPQLGDDYKEFLGFAVDGARRMDRMIIDLLEYARIGRKDVDQEMAPLPAILSSALANLEMAIGESGAEVTVPPDLPVVFGCKSELERLFQNLIGNAIKFRSPERPPRVAIECREMAGEWVIAISDNGIGIAPEDYARLFVVFQRLVSRAQYEGTGIGLAACRKIVEHHGGRIWVESAAGKGSTFLIALPKLTNLGVIPPAPRMIAIGGS